MSEAAGEREPGAYHRDLVRSLVAGRRWIVASDVLVAAAATVTSLRELGAEDVLVVAGSRGTGAVDDDLERDAVLLGVSGDTIMDGMRAFHAALAAPPVEVVDAVEAFDPDGEAMAVVPATGEAQHLVGRVVFGARPEAWRRLEDKTLVDALWDRAGVERAPSAIVPATASALTDVARQLDAGAGTMWVADNRLGWHGGAEYVHWVRDDADADRAAARLADDAHQVRVMPFLDGLPCSIHGWVFPDTVATFRPCEMVVLRVAGRSELHYAGVATAWHARPDDLRQVREVAQRVGRQLAHEVGYRGVFTVDGVMTADGFRPTELNPRLGVGLIKLGRATQLPLDLLNTASVVHPELDWRPDELERLVLEAAAAAPVAAAYAVVPDRIETEREVHVRREGERFVVVPRPVTDGVRGTVTLGPGPLGGFVQLSLDGVEAGRSVAPEAARGFALVREELGLTLPPLEAAPDLRPSPGP